MKIKISTFQIINIIVIFIDIIAFFIPVFIYDTRGYYLIDLIYTITLPIISLLITGLVATIISTILSFKGLLDMCIQYIAAILLLITSVIFMFVVIFLFNYEISLGYFLFISILSGILIMVNTSSEIKNYDKRELILPKGVVLPSIWNLIVRNLIILSFPFLRPEDNNYFLLLFFVIRGVLDLVLVFGARSVSNQIRIGGFICLIDIFIMTLFDIWFFIIFPKDNSFFIVLLIFLVILYLCQFSGAIKSFRESRDL
ncbi:MAG: hypothetical protein ACFFEY_01100 [Candidatus Thorarchaeota archaeon]